MYLSDVTILHGANYPKMAQNTQKLCSLPFCFVFDKIVKINKSISLFLKLNSVQGKKIVHDETAVVSQSSPAQMLQTALPLPWKHYMY